jgi:hypothetical protein
VVDRKRLAIHFVGKNRLRIFRQLQSNRAVEVSRSLCVRLRRGFVVERIEDNVPSGWKRAAESNDMMQRYATPLRNARPALDAAVLGNLRREARRSGRISRAPGSRRQVSTVPKRIAEGFVTCNRWAVQPATTR